VPAPFDVELSAGRLDRVAGGRDTAFGKYG
jgi:hypothetical protein